MKEGWSGDDYLVLFAEAEMRLATERYQVGRAMPGHVVIGLRGWDDLIVRDEQGGTRAVPTVPLDPQYAKPYVVPGDTTLEPDARFVGRIKWYLTPIVFGGNPSAGPNVTWVTHEQHGELVTWWNAKYRDLKASGGNA